MKGFVKIKSGKFGTVQKWVYIKPELVVAVEDYNIEMKQVEIFVSCAEWSNLRCITIRGATAEEVMGQLFPESV